MWQNVSHT